MAAAAVLAAIFVFAMVWVLIPSPSKEPRPTPNHGLLPPPPLEQTIVHEIYPDPDTAIVKPVPERPPGLPPKIAIIIDDMGYNKKWGDRFLSLDAPLTFSILPLSPHGRETAEKAAALGREVMVHLPMEPVEFPQIRVGPGAILWDMTGEQLRAAVEQDLAAVPLARGANNHMGSRITANALRMDQIFSILKENDLFFIDSRTTSDTVCPAAAKKAGIPFGQRDVFLDHVHTEKFVRNQIEALKKAAMKYHRAIGIAHPLPVTFQVLKKALPELKKDFHLVYASAMVGPEDGLAKEKTRITEENLSF